MDQDATEQNNKQEMRGEGHSSGAEQQNRESLKIRDVGRNGDYERTQGLDKMDTEANSQESWKKVGLRRDHGFGLGTI